MVHVRTRYSIRKCLWNVGGTYLMQVVYLVVGGSDTCMKLRLSGYVNLVRHSVIRILLTMLSLLVYQHRNGTPSCLLRKNSIPDQKLRSGRSLLMKWKHISKYRYTKLCRERMFSRIMMLVTKCALRRILHYESYIMFRHDCTY